MTDFYWHVHHKVLIEPLTEPFENRIAYIKAKKPAHEVETRLRLLRPVTVALPTAYDEARRAYDEAWRVYVEAWRAHDEARRAAIPELEVLHKQDCAPDCPWDGTTIFPEETR